MRIDRPLLKLPVRFDGDALAHEAAALPEAAWMAHPQKFDGNVAVPLVSPGGAMSDRWQGAMAATPHLERCSYTMEVMRAFDTTIGRSRLMGLGPGAAVPAHVDVHYYWRTHLRIHVPVITNPGVKFHCAGETVHMAPGECWLLDSFYRHSVENLGEELRVHLVIDTVGSERLWDLIDEALRGIGGEAPLIAPGTIEPRPLEFEQVNAPEVMSPWEMSAHVAYLLDWVDEGPRKDAVKNILDRFLMGWASAWARYGTAAEGKSTYIRLLDNTLTDLTPACRPPILMRNDWGLLDSIRRYVFANALADYELASGNRPGRGTHGLRATA